MKYNSGDFEKFTIDLAKKLTITDLMSLFNAVDPVAPTVFIGTNGLWNYRTSILRIKDDLQNDEVIVAVYESKSFTFRKSVIENGNPGKGFLIHIYEALTKG